MARPAGDTNAMPDFMVDLAPKALRAVDSGRVTYLR
jgi:hypothetical protein